MTLVPITVRWSRRRGHRAKTESSVTYAVDSTKILAMPSVCKSGSGSDGLVNSHVIAEIGNDVYDLYCTETTTEIAALDDA